MRQDTDLASSRVSNDFDSERQDRKLLANHVQRVPRPALLIPNKVLIAISDNCQTSTVESIWSKLQTFYKRLPVLTQDNRFFKVWNAANFLGVIFYLLEIGLLLAFGQDFWEDELQYLIVINVIFFVLFACDILLCPLKSYYHNGIMIVNRGAIFKRYVRWRIYTDSLALLGLVIPYLGKLSTLNVFKVFFFLKIPSALTIDKELLIQVRSKSRSNHVYAIARLVFIALLWAHYLGIFFFVIDLAIYNSNYYGPNTPSYCWVYNSPTEYAFIVNHRWYIQYLYSLYFSVGNVTTIAYGDIIPLNPAETVYINVCMILSVLLFTYIFKSILEAIIISRQDKFDHDYNLNLVANILKDNSISSTTAQKVKSFLEIKWSEERHRNDEVEGRMIGYLPKYLKEELLLTVHGVMLKEIGIIHPGREFLASENRSLFMYHLLQCITSEKHFVGQHLFDEGESFQENPYLYYCDTKIHAAVSIGVGQTPELQQKIDPTENLTVERMAILYYGLMKVADVTGIVGEIQFFEAKKRTHWAILNRNMEVVKISLAGFQAAEAFASNTEKQRIFMIKQLFSCRLCAICGQEGHNFMNCQSLQLKIPNLLGEERKGQYNRRYNTKWIRQHRKVGQKRSQKSHSWKNYKGYRSQWQSLQARICQQIVLEQQEAALINSEGITDDKIAQLVKLFCQGVGQQNELVKVSPSSPSDDYEVDMMHEFGIYRAGNNVSRVIEALNSKHKPVSNGILSFLCGL